jgi:recombination protein RecT
MEQTALANRTQPTGMERVKNYMLSTEVKQRFSEMMGREGIYYLNQVMILVANSDQLQKCEPASILISAMRAASLKLSVDQGQGQAWIIPYRNNRRGGIMEAQFQIGYKGVYELAMRTGLYRFINVIDIWEGEAVGEDRMTGMHKIGGKRTGDHVIGRMLYFELLSGFKKTFYMTVEEIAEHAEHYSPDNYRNPRSKWNDPHERPKMERKTVLSNGLRKWGRFNQSDLDMLDAVENERGVFEVVMPEEDEVTPPSAPVYSEGEILNKMGYDTPQETEPRPAQPAPIADIRRQNWKPNYPPEDTAFSMKDSKGTLYCEMSTADLSYHVNGYIKMIKAKPDDTTLIDKRDICKALMEATPAQDKLL